MLTLMIFLPLIGFVVNGIFGKFLPKAISGWLGTAAVLGSFVIALMSVMDLTGDTTMPERIALSKAVKPRADF